MRLPFLRGRKRRRSSIGTTGWKRYNARMTSQDPPLRRGWTTGTCATAAAKAAYAGLLTGAFPDPVEVTLPNGERPSFALAVTRSAPASATAGGAKDGGDEP